MDDREYWWLLGILGCLAVSSLLKARIIAHHDQVIREHDDDIAFLKSALRAMDERVD